MNRTAPFVVIAIVAIIAMTIAGVVLDSLNGALIIAFGTQMVMMMATKMQVENVHAEMNGMKDALVIAAKKEGKAEEKAKKDEVKPPYIQMTQ